MPDHLDADAKDHTVAQIMIGLTEAGCLIRLDSRNRQMVTSIAMTEAGTACIEDIVALACREMTEQEVRDTYLRRLRYP